METSTGTTTAADRALAIPELLEQILYQLPHLNILLIQRTSRLWRDVIVSSPAIQQRLFLRADHRLTGRYHDGKPGARPLNNLMLRKVMGGMYPTMTLRPVEFVSWEEFEVAKGKLCMSIKDGSAQRDTREEPKPPGLWTWTVNMSFPTDALLAAEEKNPAISFPEASWRRMLVSQPPATTLHLTRRWQRSMLPVIDVQDGITMQHLVLAADHKRSRWNEVYIGIDRDWHLEGPIKYSCLEQRAPREPVKVAA